jgi:methionyl-tRNA formyltransferase
VTGTIPPLVFFGSGSCGLPVLKELAAAGSVRMVVSQPDKPAGRGGKVSPTPVSEFALANGLELARPEDCNAPDVVAQVRGCGARAFAVIAYGQKMGADLLNGVFAINLHGSLLPSWRGAAPYQRALMAGDSVAGVTVIEVAERMDAGKMYARAELPIGPQMTAGELHDALSELGPGVMVRVLREWNEGRAHGEAQNEAAATRARKLSRADAWVDFTRSAECVRARINGLSPWPGCTVSIAGHALKVLRSRVSGAHAASVPVVADVAGATPGRLLPDGSVACGQGCIEILEVQPAGGKSMSFEAWRNGRKLPAGACVESSPPEAA